MVDRTEQHVTFFSNPIGEIWTKVTGQKWVPNSSIVVENSR